MRTCNITTALLALALAACASSPVTLVALPPAPHAATEHNHTRSTQTTIFLRPVVLPGYLDAYPVIIDRKGNTLIVSDKTEWAEPFPDAVARVLRDALSRQLGDSRVLIAGDGRIPDADLTVEFLALDPQHGALRLDAKWSFSCTARERPSHGGSTSFEIPLEAATAPAVAAATADALGRLAEVLATQAECVAATSRNDTPIMGDPKSQAMHLGTQPGSSSPLGATVCPQGANFTDSRKAAHWWN